MKTEIIVPGGGHNYVFMRGRGPWGLQAEEMSTYSEVPECRFATVMTAHFPVWMFFSAWHQAFVSPTSLLYLPAKPFMDNVGRLSVVLLRDECSAETLAKEKKSE